MSRTILFFFSQPLFDAGGVGRVSETLACQMLQAGQRCIFVSLKNDKAREHPDIPQIMLPDRKPGSDENKIFLRSLIEKEGVDVILNQSGLNLPILKLMRSVSDLVPVINVHHNCVMGLLECHGSIVTESMKRKGFPAIFRNPVVLKLLRLRAYSRMRKAIRQAAAGGRTLVFLFDSFLEEARLIAGETSRPAMHVINNPCPYRPKPTVLENKKKKILYVGRIEYAQKRLDRLCCVWNEVSSDLTDWSLEIVGDGPDAPRLLEWIKNSAVPRVNYHGRRESRSFFEEASLLLLTSDFEGSPMVLAEAQAMGCVPISTRSFTAIDEAILDGKTGVICELLDEDSLQAELLKLARSVDIRRAMADAAIGHVKTFSAKKITADWLQLIESKIKE